MNRRLQGALFPPVPAAAAAGAVPQHTATARRQLHAARVPVSLATGQGASPGVGEAVRDTSRSQVSGVRGDDDECATEKGRDADEADCLHDDDEDDDDDDDDDDEAPAARARARRATAARQETSSRLKGSPRMKYSREAAAFRTL